MTDDTDFEVPDSLFPTDNDFEVPELRLDMQATTCDIPFVCYGEKRRRPKMNGHGTLHFYVEDFRFTTVYNHPEKILQYEPRNIVEPNYSLFNETPVAYGLQAVYKKRTLARALQERGLRVYVDLNVANKWYAYNLMGVPRGWASFATRGYDDRINALEYEWHIARRVADGNRLTFVVYGGGDRVQEWCKEHRCIYVTPVITLRHRLQALQRMARNTDTRLLRSSVPDIETLLKEEITDYSE